jgi:hypothetical protein
MRSLRDLVGLDLQMTESPNVNRLDLFAEREVVLTVTWSWDSPAFFVMQAQAEAAEGRWLMRLSSHWGRQLVAWAHGANEPVAWFQSGLRPAGVLPERLGAEGTLTVGGRVYRWDQIVPGGLGPLAYLPRQMGLFTCAFFDENGRPLLTFSPVTSGVPWQQAGARGQVLLAPEAAALPELPVIASMGCLLRLEQGVLSYRM